MKKLNIELIIKSLKDYREWFKEKEFEGDEEKLQEIDEELEKVYNAKNICAFTDDEKFEGE